MSRAIKPKPKNTTQECSTSQPDRGEKEEATMNNVPVSTTVVVDGKPYTVELRQVRYDPNKRKFLIGNTPIPAKS